MPSRRQVLGALGVAGAALGAAALGAGALTARWYHRPHGQGYQILSDREGAVARALAGAVWPRNAVCALGGDEADLDHYLDQMMLDWPAETRDLMRVLLGAFEDLSVLDEGAPFTELAPEAQSALFMRWFDHDVSEIHLAITSVAIVLGMGWTTHPKVDGPMKHLYRCGYYR